MIILTQPMYSKQELNADSNYVVYTALINGMAKVRPDWHFIVIFPDAGSGFKYEDDGFFRKTNVTRVPQRISPRKMANAVSFDASWYDDFFRQYGVDVIWCNLVEIADKVRYAGNSTYELKALPAVVAAHNYVIHETLPYVFDTQAHVAMAQIQGAYLSDWNVFNSDWCASMLRDNVRKWYSTEVEQRIFANSSRIDYGTLETSLTPIETGNDLPVIAYNHRLQAYKNWDTTFEVLQELWNEGERFLVRFMNNTSENTSRIAKYPFVEINLCATRRDYLRVLRTCDLNVSNSQHETFCIAAIESMALGQPLVAPDGITFPEITGRKTTNYPYLFNSIAEQKSMIRQLLRDADERRRWGKVLSEHVRSSYNQVYWAEQYAALFERLTDVVYAPPDDTMRMFTDAVLRSSGKTTREVYQAINNSKTPDGRQPFSNQSLPFTKLIRMVRQIGGRVEMKNGKQVIYGPTL